MVYNKKDKNKSGIYAIKNKINGKLYVGKAKDIDQRIRQHVTQLNKKNKDENRHLISSWHKYGRHSFEYYVLEYVSFNEQVLKEKELYWIEKMRVLERDFGYNMRLDSSTNMIVHDETRKLLSLAHENRFEKFPYLKQHLSETSSKRWKEDKSLLEQMRKNVSKANTNYSIVQFTRNMELVNEFESQLYIRQNHPELYLPAILQVCNGNKASYKNFYWRYRSIETKEIIHQRKGKPYHRAVLMYDAASHEILQEFLSLKEAANFTGVANQTNIQQMCKKKTFYKTKNYYFRYKNDTEDIVQS